VKSGLRFFWGGRDVEKGKCAASRELILGADILCFGPVRSQLTGSGNF
jgi:hypothetical protein